MVCSPVCTALHEGRQLINEVYPLHVDQLFTLLFTSSKFFLDFHASRKTSDLTQTAWAHNPVDNNKARTIHLTIPLNQTLGPKSAQVTETQVPKLFQFVRCGYRITDLIKKYFSIIFIHISHFF